MNGKLATLCAIVTFLAVGLSACQTYNHLPASTEMPQSTATSPLVLVPGDEVDVRFRYWPEFDDVQVIRPDGKISLQLVQGVDAAGKTPEELQAQLIELYADKIRDPDIVVIVRNLVNQKIYVGGEVQQPGLFDLRGRMTALEAIMLAGGFDTESAHLRNVVLIRHIDGERYAGAIDMRAALRDPESSSVMLQQNDIVFVPRTKIIQANQFVDQYFNQMVPITVLQGMSLVDDLYPSAFGPDEQGRGDDDSRLTLPLDFTQPPTQFGADILNRN
jgi:polysaccharide biosynthesis/export protein